MRKVFVTGSAGFIGFHLCQLLLEEGFIVAGFDGMTDYYDVSLKRHRHQILLQNSNFTAHEAMLEDQDALRLAYETAAPDVVVHLAAQAGVRYSLENPRAYMEANVMGTFNLMELTREHGVDHLLMASTSSVYGANEDMPFIETDKTETPLTLYAATKKATEGMAHSYAHLWKIPTTMFRFFTVYGAYGRPDMALFKFVKATIEGDPIDVYNHGKMSRDFTYVTDLVRAIRLLIDAAPVEPETRADIPEGDSVSPVAPYRTVNIGNSEQVSLGAFIEAMESALGMQAKKNYMDMQHGDVPATWANATLLHTLTGYRPRTPVADGVAKFVKWYREYNNV